MVVHEEQRPMCSNNSSGGTGGSRSSKKSKQKKNPPQRGMGVKQLEELRIREQQKSAAASPFSSPSSGLVLPPARQPSLPFLTTTDPSLMYRPAVDPNTLLRPSNAADFVCSTLENPSMGCVGSTESGLLPIVWSAIDSCPHHDSEAVGRKYGFLPSLPSDSSSSNPSWWPPALRQRRQQQFSAVNKTLSPSSSSGVDLQIEPPSNQSYSSNFHIPSAWPEDERMVGMKRPWPFNLECLSNHGSFPYKVPIFTGSFFKPDESLAVYGNGSIQFEPKGTAFRDGTSSSSTNRVDCRCYDQQHDKVPNYNGVAADGGFLTLGPSPMASVSKSKHPVSTLHLHEYPEFGYLPCQGSTDDAVSRFEGLSPPPFYSFLPMEPTARETLNERRGEALDGVDLNLRL